MWSIKRSIALDNYSIIKVAFEADEEIKITRESEGIIYFKLYDKEYGIWYFNEELKTIPPMFFAVNDVGYDYPHIMTSDIEIQGDSFRNICLYETGSNVNYIQSYEEKICDAIKRLKELLTLSSCQIEREFQKEFLYYWEDVATTKVVAFVKDDKGYQRLNVYQGKNKTYRLVSTGFNLNDKSEYTHIPCIDAYYIRIIENRKIVPPTKNNPWTSKDILRIIKSRDISRISSETYKKINDDKSKWPVAMIIFEIQIDKQLLSFGVRLTFKTNTSTDLIEKIENSLVTLEPISVERYDYHTLNRQIGNDISITDKKIAIIGCGSLGSYIALELTKVGIKNFTVYDDDDIEAANILRHTVEMWACSWNKAIALKGRLESVHPEIHVEAKNKKINESNLTQDMNKYDLIIFSVGSSDIQLLSNKIFTDKHYNKPVVYAWLEAGGNDSHILVVDYSKPGCFECLFTDEEGNLINNKVNKLTNVQVEQNTIRCGCGATRVAYGTEVLLRTTSVLLNVVKKVLSGYYDENTLINIRPNKVTYNGEKFVERKCHCCGNRYDC